MTYELMNSGKNSPSIVTHHDFPEYIGVRRGHNATMSFRVLMPQKIPNDP